MSKKHNVRKTRAKSNYPRKVSEGLCGGRMADHQLSDGKRASAGRS
jgi:hypothetical protein